MTPRPRLVMVLTENWSICSPRDLRALVGMAVQAEEAGIDRVMLSEHLVLGASAGAQGRPDNPREYAAPGNQDPATPWPDSIVLASAIAAATSRIEIVLGAIIAPLRHPIALAHQLAALDLLSQGRLIVQPTVSWHREEYDALGVPWSSRGARLDEHLQAWRTLWRDTPASFAGDAYSFQDVYMEPKPFRRDGPLLWFGGIRLAPYVIRRIVTYGHGFHPFGQPTSDELRPLRAELEAAGRSFSELEVVGGLRPRFDHPDRPADLATALAGAAQQLDEGYTSLCFNPSQYLSDRSELPRLCRDLVSWAEQAG